MKTVEFNLENVKFSNIYVAGQLNSITSRLSSEVVVRTYSENGVKQAVDAKTYLGLVALLTAKTDKIEFEVRGPEEVLDAMELKTKFKKLIEESQN